jgi:urea transport system ATP-binding protein
VKAELLSHGQKQWLEIGMLLIQDPELLMLDEPVAGMSVSERIKTAELLNEIIKNRSVIVIEHDMKFTVSVPLRDTPWLLWTHPCCRHAAIAKSRATPGSTSSRL